MLAIDAPYLTARPTLGAWADLAHAWADLAHAWGFEDAAAGHDQRGSAYFEIMSPAWHAYNAGYSEGCEVFYFLTGSSRYAFITEDTQL